MAIAKVHSKYYADLDKDGINEIIEVVNYETKYHDTIFYELLVTNSNGQKIWKSRKPSYKTGGLGFSMLEPDVIGDVTNNGDIEMIISEQRSDVSPQNFYVYRWKNNKFEKLGNGILKMSSSNKKIYNWSNSDIVECTYFDSINKIISPGTIVATVVRNHNGYHRWTGKFKATENGFKLIKKIPSKSDSSTTPETSYSNTNSNSYNTRLSKKDHYNSRGARLKSVSDIIRQDRANYHKKRTHDSEDSWDGYFGTLKAREKMSRMHINVYGGKNAIKSIKNGTPLINVEINGNSLNVRIVSY